MAETIIALQKGVVGSLAAVKYVTVVQTHRSR